MEGFSKTVYYNRGMPYKVLEKDGLRILIIADSLPELFVDAVNGVEGVLGPRATKERKTITRTIILHARNVEFLLIECLNKVLASSEIYKEIYTKVELKNLTHTFLEAELFGEHVAGFKKDVKAVTYRETGIEEKDGKWRARLFFDV